MVRFVPFNVGGALCIVAATWASGVLVYALWAAPIALPYLAASITGGVDQSARAGLDIRPAHFVERDGGLLIVALGESVVGVGIGVADLVLGITDLAAGVKVSIGTIEAPLPLVPALLLGGASRCLWSATPCFGAEPVE